METAGLVWELSVVAGLILQGVYNSWKYWKSPGILLVLLENFYNLPCSVLFNYHLISRKDGTVMSVGRSSTSHAQLQTFQNSYSYMY